MGRGARLAGAAAHLDGRGRGRLFFGGAALGLVVVSGARALWRRHCGRELAAAVVVVLVV